MFDSVRGQKKLYRHPPDSADYLDKAYLMCIDDRTAETTE